MRALVVGASGGLGSAFVAQLAADATYTQIIVWSRAAAVVTGEKILAKHKYQRESPRSKSEVGCKWWSPTA
jgi:NAD(P)-dependent dehydrogenase (short-subunit alcohol dehydrogenase family)